MSRLSCCVFSGIFGLHCVHTAGKECRRRWKHAAQWGNTAIESI